MIELPPHTRSAGIEWLFAAVGLIGLAGLFGCLTWMVLSW